MNRDELKGIVGRFDPESPKHSLGGFVILLQKGEARGAIFGGDPKRGERAQQMIHSMLGTFGRRSAARDDQTRRAFAVAKTGERSPVRLIVVAEPGDDHVETAQVGSEIFGKLSGEGAIETEGFNRDYAADGTASFEQAVRDKRSGQFHVRSRKALGERSERRKREQAIAQGADMDDEDSHSAPRLDRSTCRVDDLPPRDRVEDFDLSDLIRWNGEDIAREDDHISELTDLN